MLNEVDEIIQRYNKNYGSKVDTFEFIKLLLEAKIIKKYSQGYLFYDRNYLSYFVAREIKRECAENQYMHFQHIMECSYMAINADILLFIIYMVDSPGFIRKIMEKTKEVIDGWEEYDYTRNDISFLTGSTEQVIGPVTEEDIQNDQTETIEHEREEIEELSVRNDANIFDGETEELSSLQRIMRAISLMVILARALPSFEQIMNLDEKSQCVELLYKMPLQIFQVLAKEIDAERKNLIRDIKDYYDYVYRKEKNNENNLSDDKALSILRWEASSILLELMNSSFANATRSNTIDFIDAFPYKEKSTYAVEHLMSLERRDNLPVFSKEAIDLYEKTKLPVTKNAIQRVTRKYMVKSNTIKPSDRDRLNKKIFGSGINRGKLLSETAKNRKRN